MIMRRGHQSCDSPGGRHFMKLLIGGSICLSAPSRSFADNAQGATEASRFQSTPEFGGDASPQHAGQMKSRRLIGGASSGPTGSPTEPNQRILAAY
jgi:hypothetical protein